MSEPDPLPFSWLIFIPKSENRRHTMVGKLGAHAFREGAKRSLCGFAMRENAGGPHEEGIGRRCIWCIRISQKKMREVSS